MNANEYQKECLRTEPADALGYTLEEIFEMNVEKLRARYPEGFSEELSRNRKKGDI